VTRLVVHAGMAKTGTTALQSFLTHNSEQLAEHGLTYCTGFRRRNHAELAVAFSSTVTPLTRREGVSGADSRPALRERLREIFGDPHAARSFLTSSEHLSTLVRDSADVADLADFLHSIYDEVVVLLVIRRADYWTPSAYVEAVKAGDRRPFDAGFIARRWFVLDHNDLFQRWGAAFGAESVHAVPFLESDKSDPLLLPARVLAAAGVPLGTIDEWPLPPRVANTSLSGYGTEVLRRFSKARENKDAPMAVMPKRGPIVETVRENWPGPPPLLTPEAAAELGRRRWVRTGIESTPYAGDSDDWQQWAAQPDAPTAPLSTAARRDVRRLLKLLRQKELVQPSFAGRVRRKLGLRPTR
jgi:hypothetical protein